MEINVSPGTQRNKSGMKQDEIMLEISLGSNRDSPTKEEEQEEKKEEEKEEEFVEVDLNEKD